MTYVPAADRYEKMIYRRCGKSGVKLPAVSLGLWHNFGTNDDYQNMHDTIWRRFSPTNLQRWGKPDLVLVDGGKGQLEAALKAMEVRGVDIPCIAIAKREEMIVVHDFRSHVTVPGADSDDYRVSSEGEYRVIDLHPGQRNASSHSKNLRFADAGHRYDNVVKLFQRVRDEAHRFAVSYHTVLKRKRQTHSSIEDIPGIGPSTRKALIRKFGSLSAARRATIEDVTETVGVSKATKLASWHEADARES